MSMKSDYERKTGRKLARMVFINVDERGNYVYRFEWFTDIRGVGRQGGSSTFATSKSGSTWSFDKPNYNAEARQQGEDLNRFLQQEDHRRDFNGKFNLHINVPYGSNSHHIAEAIFKAVGQALGSSVKLGGKDIPSTKGIL